MYGGKILELVPTPVLSGYYFYWLNKAFKLYAGKPLRMTWTRLSATAAAGATTIELEWGQLDWPVGATIAIATTGDFNSQKETETHTISAISNDGKTITLSEALA